MSDKDKYIDEIHRVRRQMRKETEQLSPEEHCRHSIESANAVYEEMEHIKKERLSREALTAVGQ